MTLLFARGHVRATSYSELEDAILLQGVISGHTDFPDCNSVGFLRSRRCRHDKALDRIQSIVREPLVQILRESETADLPITSRMYAG
jgi:hypothetical protein